MDSTDNQRMPLARQEELLVHELADEVLVYDLKRHKAHSLNRTSALVWKRCDGSSSVTDIARLLEVELGTSIDEDVVWLALHQLERASLLGKPTPPGLGTLRVSRRHLMRRMGLAAAVSLPMIVSIFAPTTAQAQSAGCSSVVGTPCTSDAECCLPLKCKPPSPTTCR